MAGYQTFRRQQSEIVCGKYVVPLGRKTLIMGILNTTPDSFADGGQFNAKDKAIERCLSLAADSADIIDIGGESTRPGSLPVPVNEEIERTIPVIQEASKRLTIPISIDTQKSAVAKAALNAGASLINDISAFSDPEMVEVAAEYNIPIILMHMKGTPVTMQKAPHYNDVINEIKSFLAERIEYAIKNGIDKSKIIIDPGIGFGKTLEHNLAILQHLDDFLEFGLPILIGPSRKSFIGMITGAAVNDRIFGTAAAVTASILKGVNIIRVHDVKEMREAASVADAMMYGTQTY
jgi:dihydropteroate synthase